MRQIRCRIVAAASLSGSAAAGGAQPPIIVVTRTAARRCIGLASPNFGIRASPPDRLKAPQDCGPGALDQPFSARAADAKSDEAEIRGAQVAGDTWSSARERGGAGRITGPRPAEGRGRCE